MHGEVAALCVRFRTCTKRRCRSHVDAKSWLGWTHAMFRFEPARGWRRVASHPRVDATSAPCCCAHTSLMNAHTLGCYCQTLITPREKEMPAWSRASSRDSCVSSFRRRTGDFSLYEIVVLLLPLQKKEKELEACTSGNLSTSVTLSG